MQKPGEFNQRETVSAWADITLKIWREKITDLKVYDTGLLFESLKNSLLISAGNDVGKVEFTFKLYGIFVDMGVGKEIFKGNDGDVGYDVHRKRKEWYSRIFYREVMRLKEILAEKFGEEAARQIVYAMKPIKDLKYAHARGQL